MTSACGRYVLTYNGEIYSAPELRPELEALGRRFRGHSDTEIIVEGIAAWGVRATVERLIGMFAFAVFDRKERRLSLVRDRLGIKPLYWGRQNGRVVFASELKALRGAPRMAPRDRSRRARVLSPLRLCAVAAFDLSRHRQARARQRRQHRGRWQDRSLDLLEPHGRRHAGQGGAARSWRGRGDGCAGIAAWRCGAAPAGLGCAARRVSLRRHQLIDRRGHDARAQQCAGQDLFHRLRREGL